MAASAPSAEEEDDNARRHAVALASPVVPGSAALELVCSEKRPAGSPWPRSRVVADATRLVVALVSAVGLLPAAG